MAIVSKLFSKTLTPTDFGTRFSVKTRSLDYFPRFERGQHAQDLIVEDEEGKPWTFRLIIRRKGYRKPVLSRGWLPFVRKKELRIGYEVTFFMEEDEATGHVKYRVELKKPYVVFKAELGYVSHCPAS